MDRAKRMIRIAVIAVPLLLVGCGLYVRGCFVSRLGYGEADLIINEVMADNLNTIRNEEGIYADWIELYNASDSEILLADYYLSDDHSELTKWRFPDETIGAGEYRIVFCDKGSGDSGRYFHANFELNADKESLYLSDRDGNIIDHISLEAQECNVSYGRINGSASIEGYLSYSTPGYANSGKLRGKVAKTADWEPVDFSLEGGLYNDSIELELSCSDDDAVIFYTLDGSEPDISSKIYRTPIIITEEKRPNRYTNQKCIIDDEEFNNADVAYGVNEVYKATVVRARVLKDGRLSEKIQTNTYFIDSDYSMPVVSLTMEPDVLFDRKDGNYVLGRSYYTAQKYEPGNVGIANFALLEDMDGNIEIYVDHTCIVNSDITFSIAGAGSRIKSIQKSFNVKMMKNTVSGKYLGTEEEYEYDAFTVRGTGSTLEEQHRYGYASSFCTNFLRQLDIDAQANVPCILFIDGEYWGIYFLTEPKGKAYIEQHYGIAKKDLEIVEPYEGVTTPGFDSFYEAVKSKDFSDDSSYEWIKTQIDMNNFMEFVIAEAYFGNTDGLKNGDHNYDIWRVSGGRWKWQAFDFDATFIDGDNYFKDLLDFDLPEDGDKKTNFSSFLFQTLWQNEQFRKEFSDRLHVLCSTTFATEHVSRAFDHHIEVLRPEMQENLARCEMDYNSLKKLSFAIRGIKAEYHNYSLEDWDHTIYDMQRQISDRAQSLVRFLDEIM